MDINKQLEREAKYNRKLAQFWLGMDNLAVSSGQWLLEHNFGSAAKAASNASDIFNRKFTEYRNNADNLERTSVRLS